MRRTRIRAACAVAYVALVLNAQEVPAPLPRNFAYVLQAEDLGKTRQETAGDGPRVENARAER